MAFDLCPTCAFDFKSCPATIKDIEFALCLGADRVVKCTYYKHFSELKEEESEAETSEAELRS